MERRVALADDFRLQTAAVSFRQRFLVGRKRLIFVTGPRGSGKSSRCAEFVSIARACGIPAGGILSIPVFDSGTKTAIELLDVGTGASRRFARRHGSDDTDVGRWKLEDGALEWANGVLRRAAGSEILLVDELGPMELLRGEGLVDGVRALDNGGYALALAVVRPELIPLVLERWPQGRVVDVGRNRSALVTLIGSQVFADSLIRLRWSSDRT